MHSLLYGALPTPAFGWFKRPIARVEDLNGMRFHAGGLAAQIYQKKVDVMAKQRAKFIEGAEKNDVPANKAEEIFDVIEKFAGYGFNKSHSAAYALISYQTAYLKAYYGPEFLVSYLSAQVGSKMEVLGGYVGEVRGLGFSVLGPDINRSGTEFTASGNTILFGLSAVGRAGASAVENIIEARDADGPFKSLWDFLTRVDLRFVNRAVTENLIKSGAFDHRRSEERRVGKECRSRWSPYH